MKQFGVASADQVGGKRRGGINLSRPCRVRVACSRQELKAAIENKREYVAIRATYRAGEIVAKALKSWCRVRDLNSRPTVYKSVLAPRQAWTRLDGTLVSH